MKGSSPWTLTTRSQSSPRTRLRDPVGAGEVRRRGQDRLAAGGADGGADALVVGRHERRAPPRAPGSSGARRGRPSARRRCRRAPSRAGGWSRCRAGMAMTTARSFPADRGPVAAGPGARRAAGPGSPGRCRTRRRRCRRRCSPAAPPAAGGAPTASASASTPTTVSPAPVTSKTSRATVGMCSGGAARLEEAHPVLAPGDQDRRAARAAQQRGPGLLDGLLAVPAAQRAPPRAPRRGSA